MTLLGKTLRCALALVSISANATAGDLPIAALTPGATNPDVTAANIHQTVCIGGWSSKVRPPPTYTDELKKTQMNQYGYTDQNPADYEEDHLIPLALGGHPKDPKNLWPEPRTSQWNSGMKDRLEYALYKAVCNGELSLDEARSAMQTDWIAAYKKYEGFVTKYEVPAGG